MTREQAKELLPVIKAYAEGKTIQVKCSQSWVEDDDLDFSYESSRYRVKPEPTYRPFKSVEECWQEMQRHKPFGWVKMNEECCHINRVCPDCVSVSDIDDYEFCEIYEYVTFADGTPFGIKVEEEQ